MNHFPNFKRTWIFFFLIGSFLAGGCATPVPVHKFLDSKLANQAHNIRVRSQIPKEEVSIRVNLQSMGNSGGGLAGLIGVLIVKSHNKSESEKAEQRIAPLLEATAGVNFRAKYWSELEKALASSSWLKVEKLEKSSVAPTEKELEERKSPCLYLSTWYELSANARVLIIQTKARLYLKEKNEADYYGTYTYYSNPIGKNEETDEKAIALWSANKASAYREAMAEGIEQNICMLRLDILNKQASSVSEKGSTTRLRIRDPFYNVLDIYEGKVVSRKENRLILREKGGNLFSIGSGLME